MTLFPTELDSAGHIAEQSARLTSEVRASAADAVSRTGEALWYVVYTARHRERLACLDLTRRGVCTYLPMVVVWPRPPVGSPVRPMFPSYLFVQMDLSSDLQKVSRSQGVKNLVSFGADPASLDASVVAFLRSREGPDGFIRIGENANRGTAVRITRGPFSGLTAIMERRLPTRERVLVLMNILKRQVRVEVPERFLCLV